MSEPVHIGFIIPDDLIDEVMDVIVSSQHTHLLCAHRDNIKKIWRVLLETPNENVAEKTRNKLNAMTIRPHYLT